MQKIILACLLLITISNLQAQTIYSKAFGKPKDNAIIYLHGGPGYNCSNFEITTAQRLADLGFYVIVYDRRGEGRSTDAKAQYNFVETISDLNQLYQQYTIKKATLIGHSFGGIVATRYAEQFPTQVHAIVFVGAPVSLQESFRTIQASCKKIYEGKHDTTNLKYLTMLQSMDTTSLPYASYSFMHAMQNGFYTPKKFTEEAKPLYMLFRIDSVLKTLAGNMTFEGPQGFWQQEHYTTINLTKSIQQLRAKQMPIYGLYGKEDGLYSPQQIEALEVLIGKDNVKYFDQCAHNVFLDRPTEFLQAMKRYAQ
jgi:proline iminopeptidase